ncbi:MAG: phytoene desaturase family protein [Gemmatimonadota bacterium]
MSEAAAALVLGADIEGLAAAATLAAGGRSVQLIDARERPGGLVTRFPVADGHVAPGLLTECALVRRSLLANLGLERSGLAWRDEESAVHVGRESTTPIAIRHDRVDGVAAADAEAYREWRAHIRHVGGLISRILGDTPPAVDEPGMKDLLDLAMNGLRLRSLGDADMMELLRIVTLPARDWLSERFTSPALQAGLAAPVLTGTVVGPRAAGTTALLLMREAARGVEPDGGLAALAEALVARCDQLGVSFHLGTEPTAILVDAGARRVTGVRCGDDRIDGDTVVSALDPARTLLDLVDPGLVPHHVEAELTGWRRRGDTAVHVLACSSAPAFGAEDGPPVERLITARSMVELERAADALKYGALPDEPCLDVRVWRGEPHAPAGGATLVAHVHGVPHGGEDGWDDGARTLLRNRVIDALERLSPGLGDQVGGESLLMPCDLERDFAMPGGQLYHGELALDQLWLQRPSIALSRYATPVAGLFLAGAGSHPGGPYLGGAGVLGARRALNG